MKPQSRTGSDPVFAHHQLHEVPAVNAQPCPGFCASISNHICGAD
jgi:hypothetical protein